MASAMELEKDRIDYIQRIYDDNKNSNDLGVIGFVRGVEFVVMQLGLPIKINH